MITFDTKTGLVAGSTQDIRADVEAQFLSIFGAELVTEASTPAGQLIDTLTAMLATKEAEIVRLSNMLNPYVAEGVWQDAIGYIYFLQRKLAQPTVVTVQCMGLQGVTIPQGSVVKTGNNIFLTSLEEATFPTSGIMEVQFSTQEAGPVPIPAGSVETIVTVIPGWDTVTNENDGVLGRDEETRAEFERRRFDSVAKNSHGTVSALYGAISDINNVIACVVLENRTSVPIEQSGVTIPGHSVYISVFGGSDAEIAYTIYNKLGAGCGTAGTSEVVYVDAEFFNTIYTYNITRPDEIAFYFRISIRLSDGTPADIVSRVKAAVLANFLGDDAVGSLRVTMAQTVYASRFYQSIIGAGVAELVEVVISTDGVTFSDFLYIDADRFPVLSEDNIEIIDVEGS